MANRRQPMHLVRSVVALNWLRNRGLDLAGVTAALAAGHHFDRGVIARRALARCWHGRRALRFDPKGAGVELSEVDALAETFDGLGYVFFHPLFNLLARPLRSTEAYRAAHLAFPVNLVKVQRERVAHADDEERPFARARLALMRRVNARSALSSRDRAAPTAAPSSSLAGVHQALLQLRSPLRDELMRPAGLGVDGVPAPERPWVRRNRGLGAEIDALVRAPRLDRLAAAVGLTIEAAYIGREECFVAFTELLHRESKAVLGDPLFVGVAGELALALRMVPGCPPILETDLVDAQLAALPQSWVDRLCA